MELVNNFIIAVYGAMNYSLSMPNLIGFYAKLNVIEKKKIHFALEVSYRVFSFKS